jgi:CheY-like chemotaxis protein
VFIVQIRKKILVVDDDEMHLNIARELLDDEQLEVITLHCGFGAMTLAKELQPDLVLLDINMPELSGDKLATQLRDHDNTRHIQVVFYSSNDEDSLREIVTACRADGYICKGDILDLKTKVRRYLNVLP